MTKAQFVALQNDARLLAMQIGLRAAARAMHLPETRVQKWSSRGKWGIANQPIPFRHMGRQVAPPSGEVTTALEVTQRILATHSDRTRLGFAQAATTVAEGLSERTYGQLVAPGTAISAEQWSKISDRTHGWSADRQKGTQVQVAVVSMPTPEEREERRAMHRRLDAIAARLAVDS